MPINHFSSDLPETLWWPPPPPPPPPPQQQHHPHLIMEPNPNSSSTNNRNNPFISNPNFSLPSNLYHQHHQYHPMFSPTTQNPTLNFNLNNLEDDEEESLQEDTESQQSLQQQQQQQQQQEQENGEVAVVKEFMFEKPLTPSDVGKLNRLVIPKQHAEKYFPLGADSVDKGLLLSFEDELGKCWRFRYSYWNSSQSYVLTKGWSRYVKEKQLDAGDVVLFKRHRTDGERLFIGWRRRGDNSISNSGGMMVQGSSGGVWSRGLYSSSSGQQPYQHGHGAHVISTVQYQPECLHAGYGGGQNQITPLGNSKRLRLFGVNLECQLDESEPSTPDGSSLSSQGPTQQQFYSFHHSTNYSSSSNSSHSHMDITFSRDVNKMRNRRG